MLLHSFTVLQFGLLLLRKKVGSIFARMIKGTFACIGQRSLEKEVT